ncbi:MAG: hypothetical protein M0Z94_16635, partial [Dehalococcoidales bacterium]|nr:hypothetical protein [Dehalococcoidales bacterium]
MSYFDLLRRHQGYLERIALAMLGNRADAEDALLLRRVQRAETAAPGDLEDDARVVGDRVERDLLALR